MECVYERRSAANSPVQQIRWSCMYVLTRECACSVLYGEQHGVCLCGCVWQRAGCCCLAAVVMNGKGVGYSSPVWCSGQWPCSLHMPAHGIILPFIRNDWDRSCHRRPTLGSRPFAFSLLFSSLPYSHVIHPLWLSISTVNLFAMCLSFLKVGRGEHWIWGFMEIYGNFYELKPHIFYAQIQLVCAIFVFISSPSPCILKH